MQTPAAAPSFAPAQIRSAIAAASARSGVDFGYLLRTAEVESGLNPAARAATSSAAGLFQFVGSTWFDAVRRHGAEAGVGWAADALAGGAKGLDACTRTAVLALRDDPEVAAQIAGAHAADNGAVLRGATGREAGAADLYLAHFLGAGGAVAFLRGLADDPLQEASALFPKAARANPAIFAGRSLSDIYQHFAAMFGDGAGTKVVGERAAPSAPSAAARLAYLTLAALGG